MDIKNKLLKFTRYENKNIISLSIYEFKDLIFTSNITLHKALP